MTRYSIFDWVRAIAAFGIVGCHLNLSPHTASADVLLHFSDMNVGIFGLMSGFLLASGCARLAGESWLGIWELIQRRCGRILPIYIAWSVLYVIVGLVFAFFRDGTFPERIGRVEYWLSVIFNGGASCHLWYLSALLYVSIAMLVFYRLLSARRVWPVVLVVVSFLSIGLAVWVRGNFFFYTIRLCAFVSAGMAIHHFRTALHGSFVCIATVLWVILLVVLSFSTIWPHHFIPDYLLGIGIVCLSIQIKVRDTQLGQWLGRTSLAVFLVHPFVTILVKELLRRIAGQPYGCIVVFMDWFLSYLVALTFAAVLVRFPPLRRLVL